MADDNLRSYRSRDPFARDEGNAIASEGGSDPLAELARLIGQADPYAERNARGAYRQGQSGNDAEASGLDWAAGDGYAEQHDHVDDQYVPPSPPPASYPNPAPQAHSYENEAPPDGRYFSGPAANFNGFRDDESGGGANQQMPSVRQLPVFMSAAPGDHHDHQGGQHEYDGRETYAAEDYFDDRPRPRPQSGVIIIVAVLALAVIGVAGAFAYRTMFGGYGYGYALTFSPLARVEAFFSGYSLPSLSSSLPHLPPIIKASNGPNKIMPNYGDSQANNATPPGATGTSSAEKLVSREEQPINMEPPKINSRVVSTIPTVPAQNSIPPAPITAAPVPPPAAVAPTASVPPAPSPGVAPPAPATATAPPAASAPPPVSSEPKRVHTVTIRADQAGGSEAMAAQPPGAPMPAPVASRPARTAPKPSVSASAPPAGATPPMSIVPGADGEPPAPLPPPPRARTAPGAMAVASAAPVAGVGAAASSGGRYAVQVTSQHSEADAQATFNELRAKFPNQLRGREAIIRRADLGAKGVYYRALVGPFASMEEAAGMCSSLKAAGGNCLVQRN
jgi:SPOR domain